MAICELCKGRGSIISAVADKNGLGVVTEIPCPNLKEVVVDEITHERCKRCNGTGSELIDYCPECRGIGVKHIITEKKMMLH